MSRDHPSKSAGSNRLDTGFIDADAPLHMLDDETESPGTCHMHLFMVSVFRDDLEVITALHPFRLCSQATKDNMEGRRKDHPLSFSLV